MSLSRNLFVLVAIGGAAATGPSRAAEESAHFHHIHLNVVDPAKTIDFYKKFFGAVPTKFRGVADAVLTDRSFILLNKVGSPPPWEMNNAIYHIGWGGVDGPSDFKWRDEGGIEWETTLNSLGPNHYMYAYGPDKEVIEVWTGFRHHRFGHVHLFADDVVATAKWYVEHLGLNPPGGYPPRPPKAPEDAASAGANAFRYMWMSQVSTDNDVAINVFNKPSKDSIVWWNYEGLGDLVPTDGRVIDHLAFSYPDIEPVFKRMKEAGVEIVRPIEEKPELKLKSFFVRGPDKILLEIVEATPIFGGPLE